MQELASRERLLKKRASRQQRLFFLHFFKRPPRDLENLRVRAARKDRLRNGPVGGRMIRDQQVDLLLRQGLAEVERFGGSRSLVDRKALSGEDTDHQVTGNGVSLDNQYVGHAYPT